MLTNSSILGHLTATGASVIRLCGSSVQGTTTLTGGSAVYLGDPLTDCAGNTLNGSVTVSDTTPGPTVIAGNFVMGRLACTGNSPPPTNHARSNFVLGGRTGQCIGL